MVRFEMYSEGSINKACWALKNEYDIDKWGNKGGPDWA